MYHFDDHPHKTAGLGMCSTRRAVCTTDDKQLYPTFWNGTVMLQVNLQPCNGSVTSTPPKPDMLALFSDSMGGPSAYETSYCQQDKSWVYGHPAAAISPCRHTTLSCNPRSTRVEDTITALRHIVWCLIAEIDLFSVCVCVSHQLVICGALKSTTLC